MIFRKESPKGNEQVTVPTLRELYIRLGNYYTRIGVAALGGSVISFGSIGSSRDTITTALLALLGAIGFTGGTYALRETARGKDTVEAYSDTIAHFTEHGEVDDQWLRRNLLHRETNVHHAYCWRRGVELAMRDLGLKSQWDRVARGVGLRPDHDKRI